jgi:hypothetical protein
MAWPGRPGGMVAGRRRLLAFSAAKRVKTGRDMTEIE